MKDADANSIAKPQPLTFDTDQGSSRPTWIAAALVLVLVGWMGSGFIFPTQEPEEETAKTETQLVTVAVRTSTAEPVTQFFQAEGQALPDRDTSLRAETSGEVAEVFLSKGQTAERGELIARFDTTQVEADLERAREELVRSQREFNNAEQLLTRGVATGDRVAEARADLASARSQVTNATEILKNSEIRAPFNGRIETLDLDPGEFISAGSEIGRIVDNQPLTVSIQVPQQSLTRIKNGQPAKIRFITGEERDGVVEFVGTSASAETRTFLAEIEVPNADGAIPAGISAEIRIPTGEVTAHFLSPSIVSLNADGELGVKTVSETDVVTFFPIQVARAQIDGIWVTGLPKTAQIITVGQGFVTEGETVSPQAEEPKS